MKNLNSRPFAYVIFFVFALVFSIIALVSGNYDYLSNLILVGLKSIPIVLLIVLFFVKFAWKCAFFKGWLVPFPDLNGTWQGHIQTSWKNPETGVVPGPIPVILTVVQSFTQISCVMRTSEMVSRSYLAGFWINPDEQISLLGYSYQSNPNLNVQERSAPHDGTIVFEIIGSPTTKLKGIYWTTRKTTGSIELTFRESKCCEEFPKDLGRHPVSS